MTSLYSLADFAAQGLLRNKRVFIRSDLNVPLATDGSVADDTRIRASIAAIRLAVEAQAAVMVTSHLGRPSEGTLTPQDSLAPVVAVLSSLLQQPVRLIQNWVDTPFEVRAGEVVVLENCRVNKGEKTNDKTLAAKMARLCDVYVNDAFATAHRAEATTEALAEVAPLACAGPLLLGEIQALSKALQHPTPPVLAVVGGSKVSTKLTILKNLANKVDVLVVGGGIANTFLLAMGNPIGKSLAEPNLLEEARAVIAAIKARKGTLLLPQDVITATTFSPDAHAQQKSIAEVTKDDLILDIGQQARTTLAQAVKNAGTVLWNGPVGVFEMPAFAEGTAVLARAIAASKAFSIAGGGDTIAAINQFNIADKVSYISTAGGAFLEFLEGKTLPAIAALERAYKKTHTTKT